MVYLLFFHNTSKWKKTYWIGLQAHFPIQWYRILQTKVSLKDKRGLLVKTSFFFSTKKTSCLAISHPFAWKPKGAHKTESKVPLRFWNRKSVLRQGISLSFSIVNLDRKGRSIRIDHPVKVPTYLYIDLFSEKGHLFLWKQGAWTPRLPPFL